jgi:hypothetical protein
MRYVLSMTLVLVLSVSALFPVSALSLESIEEYTSYVLQQDLSLSSVLLEVQQARSDLRQPSILEQSVLFALSDYSKADTTHSWQGLLRAQLPLSDQVDISGSLGLRTPFDMGSDLELSGSVELMLRPFFHSVEEELSQISYEQLTAQ